MENINSSSRGKTSTSSSSSSSIITSASTSKTSLSTNSTKAYNQNDIHRYMQEKKQKRLNEMRSEKEKQKREEDERKHKLAELYRKQRESASAMRAAANLSSSASSTSNTPTSLPQRSSSLTSSKSSYARSKLDMDSTETRTPYFNYDEDDMSKILSEKMKNLLNDNDKLVKAKYSEFTSLINKTPSYQSINSDDAKNDDCGYFKSFATPISSSIASSRRLKSSNESLDTINSSESGSQSSASNVNKHDRLKKICSMALDLQTQLQQTKVKLLNFSKENQQQQSVVNGDVAKNKKSSEFNKENMGVESKGTRLQALNKQIKYSTNKIDEVLLRTKEKLMDEEMESKRRDDEKKQKQMHQQEVYRKQRQQQLENNIAFRNTNSKITSRSSASSEINFDLIAEVPSVTPSVASSGGTGGENGNQTDSYKFANILSRRMQQSLDLKVPSVAVQQKVFANNGCYELENTIDDESYFCFDDEDDEGLEKSFRQLLPSESHIKMTKKELREQRERLTSSMIDQSSMLISDSINDENFSARPKLFNNLNQFKKIRASLGAPKGVKNASRLSFEDDSFKKFTDEIVKKYMKEEEMRSHHQSHLLKLREQALIEKSNAELSWLEQMKKKVRAKGEDEKMPLILKKEKGIMDRLKQEQDNIRIMKEAHRKASENRLQMLSQQVIKKHLNKLKQQSNFMVNESNLSEDVFFPPAPSAPKMQFNEPPSTKMVASSANDSLDESNSSLIETKIMKHVKQHLSSEKYLTHREKKLRSRRKQAEELILWRRKLDNEEAKVREMEKKAMKADDAKKGDTERRRLYEVDEKVNPLKEEFIGEKFAKNAKLSSIFVSKRGEALKSDSSESTSSFTKVTTSRSGPVESTNIESKIKELKRELINKKNEAIRLKHDLNLKNKIKLKEKEDLLRRQIESYDKLISRIKCELSDEDIKLNENHPACCSSKMESTAIGEDVDFVATKNTGRVVNRDFLSLIDNRITLRNRTESTDEDVESLPIEKLVEIKDEISVVPKDENKAAQRSVEETLNENIIELITKADVKFNENLEKDVNNEDNLAAKFESTDDENVIVSTRLIENELVPDNLLIDNELVGDKVDDNVGGEVKLEQHSEVQAVHDPIVDIPALNLEQVVTTETKVLETKLNSFLADSFSLKNVSYSREKVSAIYVEAFNKHYWPLKIKNLPMIDVELPQSIVDMKLGEVNEYEMPFRCMLFDLIGQLMQDLYLENYEAGESVSAFEPKMKKMPKKLFFRNYHRGPRDRQKAFELVKEKLFEILGFNVAPKSGEDGVKSKWRCRNRSSSVDIIDRILMGEIKQEENDWCNYDHEVLETKVIMADSVLDYLLKDTLDFYRTKLY